MLGAPWQTPTEWSQKIDGWSFTAISFGTTFNGFKFAELLPGAKFQVDSPLVEFMLNLRQMATPAGMSISDMVAVSGTTSRDKANLAILRNVRNVVAIEQLLKSVPLVYSSNRTGTLSDLPPSLKDIQGKVEYEKVSRWRTEAPPAGPGLLACTDTHLAGTAA